MNSGKRKRVLILEISWSGHHPYHVRLLLDSGLGRSADIILAAQDQMLSHPAIAGCSSQFKSLRIDVGPDLELQPDGSDFPALLRMQWGIGSLYRKAFTEASADGPIDFVIIPFVDNCLLNLATPPSPFGTTPWLALTMRTMLHYRAMGVLAPEQRFAALRRWILRRTLKQRKMAALLTIDPTLKEFSQRQRESWYRKIHYVPDPVVHHHSRLPPQADARQRLGLPSGACIVLLYGEMTARKGASQLIGAAASPLCSQQVHVVLAGRNRMPEEFQRSETYKTLVAQQRLHTFDGFIDDAHEQLLLASADCMWAAYLDFYGFSGVMALAGRHAVPVLASVYGLIGYLTGKYRLGVAVDPLDQAAVVSALNRLVQEPDYFTRAGQNGLAAFAHYSPTDYQRLVTDMALRS